MRNRKNTRRRNRPSAGGNGTKAAAERRAAVTGTDAEEAAEAPDGAKRARRRAVDRPRGPFGTRLREPSPYPKFTETIAEGVAAAGSSPAVLLIAFLAVLALWAAHQAVGAGDLVTPKAMANLMALPPIHILFTDTNVAFSAVPAFSPAAKLALAVGFTIARGLAFGAIIALLGSRLGWAEDRPLARWARAIPNLLAIALAFFGVAAAIPYLLLTMLPGQLGTLAVLAGPVVGLHFLAFAPVTAVLDGAGYREAIRRSARAARLPGGSHLALSFGYFAFALFLISIVPQPPVAPATPSVQSWAVSLATTFVHVSVLGAFVYRWLVVRDQVPKEAAPRAKGGGGLRARLGR
jgi:hypothetical protein